MSIQLEARHAEIVMQILARRLPGARVLVFGSRARGDAAPYSDLDLLIVDETLGDEATLAELELDFAASDLPFRVDIATRWRLDAAFRRRIEAEAIAIQDLAPV